MDHNQQELWCPETRGDKYILLNHCCVVFRSWEQGTVNECMMATGEGVEVALERAGTETGIKRVRNRDKRASETGVNMVSETGIKGYRKRG